MVTLLCKIMLVKQIKQLLLLPLFAHKVLINHVFHSGYWSISTFVHLQTGWSQDQVPHMWDLILASACLPLELYFFSKLLPNKDFSNECRRHFLLRPFCIPAYNGFINHVFLGSSIAKGEEGYKIYNVWSLYNDTPFEVELLFGCSHNGYNRAHSVTIYTIYT